MRSSLSFVAMSLVAVGCSKAKDSKPAEAPAAPVKTPAPPAGAPTTPASGVAAPSPAPGTATPGAGPIDFEEIPDDASCTKYVPRRGGAAMTIPADIADALACPITAPELLPSGDGFVYLRSRERELMFWKPGADPRRLVLFEAPDDDSFSTSVPAWSPDGTKLALIAMSSTYPERTRLFVLTIDPAGAVTAKVKHDVRVFSPCGSVCRPTIPAWQGNAAVEVTDDTDDGAPGAKHLIKL
ncbi:MAG: hypothetical protein R3B06_03285 [Kofleriaceae bacterium]